MRSTLLHVHKPKCPQCDATGIRRIGPNFFHDQSRLRCMSCHHEWAVPVGRPGWTGTNRTPSSRKEPS
jgi:transposase-like protein